MSLQRLDATASPDALVAALDDQGYVIIENWIAPQRLQGLNAELAAELAATPEENEDFGGKKTKRFGGLLGKSPAAAALALDPLLIGLADRVLLPHCAAYQISYTGVASIQPGEDEQVLHRDSNLYPVLNPSPPLVLSTVWAINDFTPENGATRLVPGSHLWPQERKPEPSEVVQAVMPAGSCLIYLGNVIHGGGANRSTGERTGVLFQLCLGWLRQEENQYLSVPPEVARSLDPRLQRLMGYSFGGVSLGMVDRGDPLDALHGHQRRPGGFDYDQDLLEADKNMRWLSVSSADPASRRRD
ncbi:MAG: phytanoyl-CoA dioxygenase family protein [Pseudomonadota bacterium]